MPCPRFHRDIGGDYRRIRKGFMKRKVVAIITAAGSGLRIKGPVKKQFRELSGKPVIAWSLDVFEKSKIVNEVILTVPRGKESYVRNNIIKKYNYKKIGKIISGGLHRQDSVFNALKQVNGDCSVVVIHDGVRPFVTEKMIHDSVMAAEEHGASIVAVPLIDTIKKVDSRGFVLTTISRENVWKTQTPQAFRYDLVMRAHTKFFRDKFRVTDDAVMIESIQEAVKVVMGSYRNIKLTSAEDFAIAESLLNAETKKTRHGIGYDIHKLEAGRKLILGGVKIPFNKGFIGHSDGDALVHSICDAILGSIGEADIGVHFPDTDKKYKGISSLLLLDEVMNILSEKGYSINNLDSMIIAQAPRITPYVEKMKKMLAAALNIGTGSIGIKATTNENIGLIGQGKGIAAYSVVSVIRK